MRKTVPLIWLIMAALVGCSREQNHDAGDPHDCVPTPVVRGESPVDDPALLGSNKTWYVNADRSIWWVYITDFTAGERTKVGWYRPANTLLTITGRRLDAPAPPLKVETETFLAERRFQPCLVTFPTEGCWEVVAKGGASEARFVLKVRPAQASATSMPAGTQRREKL